MDAELNNKHHLHHGLKRLRCSVQNYDWGEKGLILKLQSFMLWIPGLKILGLLLWWNMKMVWRMGLVSSLIAWVWKNGLLTILMCLEISFLIGGAVILLFLFNLSPPCKQLRESNNIIFPFFFFQNQEIFILKILLKSEKVKLNLKLCVPGFFKNLLLLPNIISFDCMIFFSMTIARPNCRKRNC